MTMHFDFVRDGVEEETGRARTRPAKLVEILNPSRERKRPIAGSSSLTLRAQIGLERSEQSQATPCS